MKNLASAYIKAQMEMAPLLKDKKGNFGNYSTLASVQDVCLPAFGKHGIAVFQEVSTVWDDANRVHVRIDCMLIHAESGETREYKPLFLIPTKTDPQGIGSAITYGRRYSLMAVAGIAPEDDDGTEASKPAKQQPQPQTTPAHRQPPANNKTEKSNAFKAFMAEGTTLFNGEWDNARHWLIERYTKRYTPDNVRTSANDLTDTELSELSTAIKSRGATLKSDWQAQTKKEVA